VEIIEQSISFFLAFVSVIKSYANSLIRVVGGIPIAGVLCGEGIGGIVADVETLDQGAALSTTKAARVSR
jgi:hypothetical protein